jgi:hypothetical protein
LGHYDTPSSFKSDLDILERYQAFSAEILRIALLGLSGLGVLIFNSFFVRPERNATLPELPFDARWGVMGAAVLFGIAAAAALVHRYCSADSAACHLRVLRLQVAGREADDERKRRNSMLAWSRRSIAAGATFLGLAGLTFVVAIGFVVFK